MTTSLRPTREQMLLARSLAGEIGVPFISREKRSIPALAEEYAANAVVVVTARRVSCFVEGVEFFFHPCMASLRIKEIKAGKTDQMIKAMELRPGDSVLDCTLGLAVDAIVASFVVGPGGLVVGLEASSVIKALVRHGLSTYREASPDVIDSMRRIKVEHADHREYLAGLPDRSFDVVYFDPMFRRPGLKSSAMNALRPLARHDSVSPETIEEAWRVARRRVVLKENRLSPEFSRLGFRVVQGGKHSPIAYGVLNKEERS